MGPVVHCSITPLGVSYTTIAVIEVPRSGKVIV